MCPTTPAVLCLVFMAKALAQSPLATTSPPTYSVEGRSNGTIGLLRERELLLARVAAIDSEIEHERNLKRRALTEAYERAMDGFSYIYYVEVRFRRARAAGGWRAPAPRSHPHT